MAENSNIITIQRDDDERKRNIIKLKDNAEVLDAFPDDPVFETSPLANFMGGVQTGVSTLLQAPFDVGRAVNQMIFGGDVASWLPNYDPNKETPGADFFSELFQKSGELEQDFFANSIFKGGILDLDRLYDPDSYGHQIGKEAVYNVASLMPVLGAAGQAPNIARQTALLGRKGGAEKVTYEMFQPMLSYVRQNPLQASLIDLGLSFPMGVGAKFGRDVGSHTSWLGPQTGEELGRLTALGLATTPPALGRAAKSLWDRSTDWAGLSEGSKKRTVAEALTKVMTPEQRLMLESGDFDTPVLGGPFTTAEILDSGGLGKLRAETIARLNRTDAPIKADQAREDRLLREMDTYRDEIDPATSPELERQSVELLAKRIDDTLSRIDSHTKTATANAQSRIDNLSVDESLETASIIAREELQTAHDLAFEEQDRLWKAIGNGMFGTDNIIAKAKSIITGQARLSGPKGQPAIPEVIWEVAGRDAIIGPDGKVIRKAEPTILRDIEPVKEISALSKRINGLIRDSNNLEEKRLLRELRDTLYDGLTPLSGEGTEALALARAYSKYFSDTFYKGAVGRVLGYKDIDTKVDPILTLSQFIRPGLTGKSLVNSLRKASSDSQDSLRGQNLGVVDERIQTQLLNKFYLSVLNRGTKDIVSTADSFIRNYPILDLYPELKAAMLDGATAKKLLQHVDATSVSRTKAVNEMSVAARYIDGGDPTVAIHQIMTDRKINPVKSMNELIKMVSKDPTGQALKGVKSAFYNSMMNNITRETPDGRMFLHYNSAQKYIKNKTNRAVIKSVYGNDGLKILDDVLKGMQYQNRGKDFPARFTGDSTQNPMSRELAGNMGTVFGARLLGATLGSPLLGAGSGKRGVLRIFDWFTNAPAEDTAVMLQRALDNPEIAKIMVKPFSKYTNEDSLSIIEFISLSGVMPELLSETLVEPLQ